MNKTNRITDRQITNIVRKALNEVDWKLYANAAQKALEKGDPRTYRFLSAARERFREKHPHNSYHHDHYNPKEFGSKERSYLPAYSEYLRFSPTIDIDDSNKTLNGWIEAGRYLHHAYDGPYVMQYYKKKFSKDKTEIPELTGGFNEPLKVPANGPFDDVFSCTGTNSCPKPQWDWQAASDDMENYFSGKTHYKKGKGWITDNTVKMNESQFINLVKKTVKRVMNEARSKKQQTEQPRKNFQEALDDQVKEMLAKKPGWNIIDNFWGDHGETDAEGMGYTFEYYHNDNRGGNFSNVMKDGVWYGVLIEREQNFFLPIFCTILTPDVEKIMRGEEGDEEFTLMGVYADMIGFDTFDKFVDYINAHQREWQMIHEYQETHAKD